MGNFIQTILNLLKSLLGGGKATTPTTETPATDDSCSLFDIEIPADYDESAIPIISASDEIAAQAAALSASAQGHAKSCQIQIRSSLGRVNVRGGPRLDFGPLALVEGGVFVDLTGASEADPDGYRWYNVKTSGINGWVRGDTVIIGEDCLTFSFITEADITPPEPTEPQPSDKFALPADVRINLGYSRTHRGYDLATDSGTPIYAAAPGLVIRALNCIACEDRSRPNFYPCPDWVLRSKDWGYGYGNTVTVRHDYHILPPTLRSAMADKGLQNGYAYVLYAHFSELRVELGQTVKAGDLLGLTGNHGCSSAPHLHFEVRIGKDETVDGHWLDQTPVNPNLIFKS